MKLAYLVAIIVTIFGLIACTEKQNSKAVDVKANEVSTLNGTEPDSQLKTDIEKFSYIIVRNLIPVYLNSFIEPH